MRIFLSYSPVCLVSLALLMFTRALAAGPGASPAFVRLVPLPSPKIVAHSESYPGGAYEPGHLLDGNPATEHCSNGKGTNTFIEFDFGAPTRIVAFRHRDRNDPATVAASELEFRDAVGQAMSTVLVTHVNQRAGVTFFVLPEPVTAQRVRWRVSALGAKSFGTVGGAEIGFLAAGEPESVPRGIAIEARPFRMLERKDGQLWQPLQVTLDYPYAAPVETVVRVAGGEPRPVTLRPGSQTFDFALPSIQTPQPFSVTVEVAGQSVASRNFTREPVRQLDIYLLPHSHVDIGYTALQADVEKKQNENIEIALRLIRETRDYPLATFKWNVEVLWPVENYLRAATPEKRAEFIAAVKAGHVGLDAMHGNTLTGLCRPEELLRLMTYATRLSAECGVPIESAMISDVPGYTWSTVSALAHAGVKYFSFAPNYFDRMGGTMVTWQNRPFWWAGPDGTNRVLCWCPSRGYALGHLIGDGEALARFLPDYLVELETNSYPYEVTHLRWNVHGDNGSPDEKVADVVRDWNRRYASPRLNLATTAEAFREFEKRYGADLPVFRGDYTPYWEDGAASSALETAMNRASAERLVQAETLWALRNPGAFPADRFYQAWRNVLLYSEHTWGAHNSISQPDLPFVRDQWKVKQTFALDADRQSRALLGEALGHRTGSGALEVFNTCSWPRTDLVTVSRELSTAGDRVVDEKGKAVPSQRLASGELVFLAKEVPAFSSRVYRVEAGAVPARGAVYASRATLTHPDFTLRLDERTGAIASFQSRAAKADLVDATAATALNDFFYLPGSNVKDARRNGPPRIAVKERGPLVAALLVESDAPGCKRLVREVRVVDGLDRVELINTVDKQPVRKKEGLHFGFGFNVPGGTVRMDVGWAVVRPELDQMPAACKNWFSVQRWVDIANNRYGVTWAPVDAPLVQVGGLTANLVGSQTDHRVWIQHLEPSQTIYSWVMNNHWHTNYRADQEGPTVFRYFLRPHRGYSALEAARFGLACSQPLMVAQASGRTARPLFELSSDAVLVSAFKPSDDGRAWIVRLFGASGEKQQVRLSWLEAKPKEVWLSNTSEQPLLEAGRSVEVPPWGIVTLRAER